MLFCFCVVFGYGVNVAMAQSEPTPTVCYPCANTPTPRATIAIFDPYAPTPTDIFVGACPDSSLLLDESLYTRDYQYWCGHCFPTVTTWLDEWREGTNTPVPDDYCDPDMGPCPPTSTPAPTLTSTASVTDTPTPAPGTLRLRLRLRWVIL